MIKKIIVFLITAVTAAGIISGCVPDGAVKNAEKISVVCTVFPQYDWAREIIKGAEDKIDLTLLINNGTDIHSFQPSADDIIKLSSCDLAIFIGGVSDEWVRDAVQKSAGTKTINMLEELGDDVKSELHVDGMQTEHKHEKTAEADEHVWLSLENAAEICGEIAEKLGQLDMQNKELFEKNAQEYIKKLDSLDDEYESAVENSTYKTLVFADRFPFRYMTDDYDITYYAAFPGCSAESEASFETIAFLAGKLDSQNLPAVIMIDGGDRTIAETVINNTKNKNQKIISLNSMQSVTKQDIDGGLTYLSVMKNNLSALKQALN